MSTRPIHFEFQANDPERAQAFYRNVLGWKVDKYAPTEPGAMPGMEYWTIDTGKDGPGINGGMYRRPEKVEQQKFLYDMTIQVPDIEKAMADVKTSGGQIVGEKMEMKGLGFFANATDPEGNTFHLMQPTEWQAK